tara:strand:- start:450 stop:1256 length:807 start_codon:yes stop_codon:yes gene_type:complete
MPALSTFNVWDDSTLGLLIVGASLLYIGGCTLNDAVDHNFDAQHNPHRPIPSRALTATAVWVIGIIELALGAWVMIEGARCSSLWVSLLLVALVAYDLAHKKWNGSFILMGCCRLFLWVAAATAGGMTFIAPQTWAWGIALMAYVMGITLHARGEATDRVHAHRVSILLLFATPLLALMALVYWNNLDPIRVFLVNLSGLLAAWIAMRAILRMREGEPGCIGAGVSRLLSGICALDATVLAFVAPILVGPVILGVSFAQMLQKKFAAT